MPSSLIIIGLAAAWLVVLVPMVARKRQEVTQTSDSALAGRIVRSGTRGNGRRDVAVSGDANTREGRVEDADARDDYDYDYDMDDMDPDMDADYEADYADDRVDHRVDQAEADYDDAGDVADGAPVDDRDVRDDRDVDDAEPVQRRYRPGRGGFDPEAAEITARAKYAYRQRVVLILLIAAVASAIVAAVVAPMLWWLHGAVDVALVGYLGYLRRQVRIEEEIRQRRMARYAGGGRRPRRAPEPERYADSEYDLDDEYAYDERFHDEDSEVDPRPARRPGQSGPQLVSVEHRRAPRPPRNTVVVDIDDEDPAFHELGDPGELPYRRAVGE